MSVILASKNIRSPKVYDLGPVISLPVAVDEMSNQSHIKVAAAFLKSPFKKTKKQNKKRVGVVQATLWKVAKEPKL